ncbi:hypothetical protein ACFLQY_04010 [Verrucomicrobiota bacterium]
MNALFRHARAGTHHQHHYISHLIHDERFWAGVGITLLIGAIIVLAIYAAHMEAPPTTFFPYY